MQLERALKLLRKYGEVSEHWLKDQYNNYANFSIEVNHIAVIFDYSTWRGVNNFRTICWTSGRLVETYKRYPNLTAALRYALRRQATVRVNLADPTSDRKNELLICVHITHEGLALKPTPTFKIQASSTTLWIDAPTTEGLSMAESVIAGDCDGAVLLDWLSDKDERIQQVVLEYRAARLCKCGNEAIVGVRSLPSTQETLMCETCYKAVLRRPGGISARQLPR